MRAKKSWQQYSVTPTVYKSNQLHAINYSFGLTCFQFSLRILQEPTFTYTYKVIYLFENSIIVCLCTYLTSGSGRKNSLMLAWIHFIDKLENFLFDFPHFILAQKIFYNKQPICAEFVNLRLS